MLDQELWKPLPMPADRQTSFKAALEGSKPNRTPQTFDTSSFADWVEAGNPWKKQESGMSQNLLVNCDDLDCVFRRPEDL